jgi:hypothetical protein
MKKKNRRKDTIPESVAEDVKGEAIDSTGDKECGDFTVSSA